MISIDKVMMMKDFSTKNSDRVSTLCLLLLAAASTWFCFHTQSSLNHQVVRAPEQHRADAFMEQVEFTEFNHDGNPSSRLVANNAYQYTYPSQQVMVFQKPSLQVQNGEHHWDIQSGLGIASMSKQHSAVKLQEGVNANEHDQNHKLITKITTRSLEFNPHTQKANTADPITLDQANQHIKAVGMDADFKLGMIRLHSNVRGSYDFL
jgi:LPS export ABC transporter protein LptC